MIKRLSGQPKGFTIVELLIATTIFSTIILLCAFSMLEISRAYLKAVTITRTQEAARDVIEDISQAIQFSSSGDNTITLNLSGGVDGAQGFCIDKRLYSFVPGKKRDENDPNNNAFTVRNVNNNCSTETPDVASGDKEFLGLNMRVVEASVSELERRVYLVNIVIASGEADDFEDPATFRQCSGRRSSSQYCAVAELSTIVRKRL